MFYGFYNVINILLIDFDFNKLHCCENSTIVYVTFERFPIQ